MATEKTILAVDLYDNVLTETPGDYTGKFRITGTTRNANIADRIVEKRTEYRRETIINILDLADQEKVKAVAAGKSLIDGFGQYLLNISGSFDGKKEAYSSPNNPIGVTFTPGKSLLDSLKNIQFDAAIAQVGPFINSITDSTTGKVNNILTPGAPAVIAGSILLLKGEDPSVGVYFTPDGGSEAQKVGLVVTNTKSQIIISIPQLVAGQYTLSVTTQAGGSYTVVKAPRTYVFPILLTVGDETNPDENPDIL